MFITCNIISAAFGMFLYITFRSGIYSYLRVSGYSKSYIKKMRKGFFNYLLYTKLHKEGAVGWV